MARARGPRREDPRAPRTRVSLPQREEFEEFDPTQGEQFEEFDVSAETTVTAEATTGALGGVTTDVEESGEIVAHMFTARRRPAPCGVSIGNCNRIMAGTLGCLVARNNQLFVLSNNHVMALVNTSPLNAGIPQPGRLDG